MGMQLGRQPGTRRGVQALGLMAIAGVIGVGLSGAIAQGTAAQESPTQLQQTLLKDGRLPIPSRQEFTQIQPPNKFPLPAIRMPSDGNIYLVNYTNAKIDYAVLGLTGESILTGLLEAPEQSVVELPKLDRPINLSLSRQDRGFILVRTIVKGGDLYLVMDFAPSLQLDTNYINIKEDGEVYLY